MIVLAAQLEQLTPEASEALAAELSRRGIKREEINSCSETRRSDPNPEKKPARELAYFLWPGLRRIRETIADWTHYRRQTGKWPSHSIAFYFVSLGVRIAYLVLAVWYGVQHDWSSGRLVAVVLPVVVVDVVISNRLQKRIRLSEIRSSRRQHIP